MTLRTGIMDQSIVKFKLITDEPVAPVFVLIVVQCSGIFSIIIKIMSFFNHKLAYICDAKERRARGEIHPFSP